MRRCKLNIKQIIVVENFYSKSLQITRTMKNTHFTANFCSIYKRAIALMLMLNV